jgi:predicted DNA binding CopG/RHH family protein
MRKINLTRQEKAVEDSLLKGEYANVGKSEFEAIAESIAARKKDAVLNVRVNSRDLATIRQRAQKLGIKYQTFISEVIHRIAQAR